MQNIRTYSVLLLLLAIQLLIASCGTSGRLGRSTAGTDRGKAIETGMASWYGPKFHGKLTANGEVYNMYSMTAAHRTLPFNTLVRVENLDNGESVVVRINDRGPFAKNRIIDLSKKAAEELEMTGPGTARVRLYLIRGDGAKISSTDLKTATYTVQLGSYIEEDRALQVSRKIDGSRIEKVYLEGGSAVYRIYYGVYSDRESAETARRKLDRKGYEGYVKQLQN